ncbi:hypothetical protein B484DRAFT_62954 [Ochromonadaceae sp. CCMP2298]|nr:hypothetical protein B484DRAFT_62954 [Ochromonadaceae sp. CCMP2298]
MMCLFSWFVLILVVGHGSSSISKTWKETSAPTQSYNSVTSSTGGAYLAAAGAGNGGIYVSADNGSTWTLSSAPFGDWVCITSSSCGQFLAAAIYAGSIWTSSDFAATWNESSVQAAPWASITSSSSGQKMAAASFETGTEWGEVYTSDDFGSTWAPANSPVGSWHGITSSGSGQGLVLAGGTTGNQIFFSNDNGLTWANSTLPASTDPALGFAIWQSLVSSASGQYVAAAGGVIIFSSDFGATFDRVSAPSTSQWSCIAMDTTGQYLAAAAEGSGIINSVDYGVSWLPTNAPTLYWTALASSSIATTSSGQRFIAVVNGGGIYVNYCACIGGDEYCDLTSVGESCVACTATTGSSVQCPSTSYDSSTNQCCAEDIDNCPEGTTYSTSTYLCSVCTTSAFVCTSGGSTKCCGAGTTHCSDGSCIACEATAASALCPSLYADPITGQCCASSQGVCPAGSFFDDTTGLCGCGFEQLACGDNCCDRTSGFCDNGSCSQCDQSTTSTICPSHYADPATDQCCAAGQEECPEDSYFDLVTGLCSCGAGQLTCGELCCLQGSEYCNPDSTCSSCSHVSPSFCPSGLASNASTYGAGNCCGVDQSDCPSDSSYDGNEGYCNVTCAAGSQQCGYNLCFEPGQQVCVSPDSLLYDGTAAYSVLACTVDSLCPSGYQAGGQCCAGSSGQCNEGSVLTTNGGGYCVCSEDSGCSGDDGEVYCFEESCVECLDQTDCPVKEYCNDHTCHACSYPWVYPLHFAQGSTRSQSERHSCTGIDINMPDEISIAYSCLVAVGLVVAFGGSVRLLSADVRVSMSLFYLIGIPTFDVLTDTLYLLTTTFYSLPLFLLSLFCVCGPSLLFLSALHSMNASPRWYICTPPESVYPIYLSRLVSSSSRSLISLLSTLGYSCARVSWAVLKLTPWLLANSVFLFPLMIAGTFLYSTKLLNLRGPRVLFFRLWTGSYDMVPVDSSPLDIVAFNISFYSIVFAETLPILLLLFVNQSTTNRWTFLAKLSGSLSLVMLLNSLWKYFYLKSVRGLDFEAFPLEVPFVGLLVEYEGDIWLKSMVPGLRETELEMHSTTGNPILGLSHNQLELLLPLLRKEITQGIAASEARQDKKTDDKIAQVERSFEQYVGKEPEPDADADT